MKKLIAGAAIISTILGSGAAALADTTPTTTATTTAQTGSTVESSTDAQLPQVTMTPDKILYVLKLWVEKIQLVITTDAADRAAILETQAQTRLAEAKAMAEAGKQDLAQTALDEAKAKLEAAQKEIEAAAKANKDMTELSTKISADQNKFADAINVMLAKAPEQVRAEFEPVAAELMVQIAANQDAAKQDEAARQEAEKLAEQADMEGLQPRMVLVLNAMANASGKDLKDVYAMYKVNPGLGRIAKALGLKMGAVQHAAQIQWKLVQAGDVTTAPTAQTTAPALTTTQAQTGTAAATSTTVTTEEEDDDAKIDADSKTTIVIPGLNLAQKGKENAEQGKGHEKQEEHGKGNGNGKH
jgi:hypothetical protein